MKGLSIMIITIVVLHSCSGQEKNNLLTEENELEDGKNKEIEVKGEPKEEIFEIEEYLITPKSIGFAFLVPSGVSLRTPRLMGF